MDDQSGTATVEVQELPFHRIFLEAEGLMDEMEPLMQRLRIAVRDIDAAERTEAWRSANEQGKELFHIAVRIVDQADYVLRVAEAQHIGNSSEAWHSGVRRLRKSLDAFKNLSS